MAIQLPGDDEGGGGIVAEINITPLTDVFLVLLIIFMVTSSVIANTGKKVDLPSAQEAGKTPPKAVNVTISTDGTIQVDGDVVKRDALQAAIKAALEVAGIEQPKSASEARFSTKYTVATALTHGSVRFAAFEPERLEDPATRELMRRIELAIDPALDAAFPRQRAARVAIETRTGRREEFLQPTRIGDPDAPLSDQQLGDKYLELAGPVLGARRARALLARLWRLEHEPHCDLSE